MLTWIRRLRLHIQIQKAIRYAENNFDVPHLTIESYSHALRHRQRNYALVARIQEEQPTSEELNLLAAVLLIESGLPGNWSKAFESFRDLCRRNLIRDAMFREFVQARRNSKASRSRSKSGSVVST